MASSQPPNPFDEVVAAAFSRLTEAQTQALATNLLHIHLRAKVGTLSHLEAAIEQMKVIQEVCPFDEVAQVIAALEAFNDGDHAAINFLLEN